jgi:ribosomal protein S18 acetylase RimI-like enzyme
VDIPLEIRPLSPSLIPDYLDYFDQRAFADNPDWAFCYCNFLYADRKVKPWGEYSANENREAVIQLVGAGRLRGYLAYVDDQAIGWCNAAPKTLIPELKDLWPEDADQIGSIGCFVIAKAFRRQGIGRRLLAAACEGFQAEGLKIVEGYPLPSSQDESANHFGPLKMFLSYGFEHFEQNQSKRAIVRKMLN